MFQPQPTPFAASYFTPPIYDIPSPAVDSSFAIPAAAPPPAGGGGGTAEFAPELAGLGFDQAQAHAFGDGLGIVDHGLGAAAAPAPAPVAANSGSAAIVSGAPLTPNLTAPACTNIPFRYISRRQRLSTSSSSSTSTSASPPATTNSSSSPGSTRHVATAPHSHHRFLHQQHHRRRGLISKSKPQHRSGIPHRPAPATVKMEQQQQVHDVEAQQEAAKDYQPVHEGPCVGDKTPSDAVTHEYAKADPVYVEKTIALPQTYSHYRAIRGDGNCGWRAIGFSYYEKLIEVGNQMQIEGEVARLMSLNQMLMTVGGYSYVEDWSDEATGLLRDLAANISDPSMAHIILMDRWNDESSAGHIIYYLRLLAATYLKANAETYDPFIPDALGVAAYCSQSIEPPNREIENLGIVALAEILLKPVNLVLEIAYLDRSAGSQVNCYRFPEEANGQNVGSLGPIIYLLYRPDHYDILYHASAPSESPLQVHRVDGFTHNMNIRSDSDMRAFSTVDFHAITDIPTSFAPAALSPMAPPLVASPMEESFTNSPQTQQRSQWVGQYSETIPSTTPEAAMPPHDMPMIASGTGMPMPPGAEMDSSAPMMAGPGLVQGMPNSGYLIRFSPVQLEYNEGKNHFPEPAFQVTTSTFKNSVYNRAHYGNPDFHPEEYNPERDSREVKMGGKKKVKKEN
ncbi:hypothetical protein S40285_07578 [Stachybotrys chlorohalonatus IBT 40285]|uniref:ubiquitinyl hydrolase 1 n=1 Tax=Stachybotrys chlorohalonatus (strain IBT 40285) TaxID=1283841 RepID=A0A084Q996_STAC4|nr:hypothetical protein S40285_07578 [Stachybotrys chlorohalonata IBT 40285]